MNLQVIIDEIANSFFDVSSCTPLCVSFQSYSVKLNKTFVEIYTTLVRTECSTRLLLFVDNKVKMARKPRFNSG